MRRAIFSLCTFAACVFSTAAFAIVNGQPDGSAHPAVGALIGRAPDGSYHLFCSGVLIGPRTVVTAAHCVTIAVDNASVDQIYVNFEPQASTDGLIHGVASIDSSYNPNTGDNDLAVLTLATEPDVTPASLPTLRSLDSYTGSGNANKATFDVVGYGVASVDFGSGKPSLIAPDGLRRIATAGFNALNDGYLTLSVNPAQGFGGACYGDSGGPTFAAGTMTVVALHESVDNWCRAHEVATRLDTVSARSFLGQYLTLP